MGTLLRVCNVDTDYLRILEYVYRRGIAARPRGMETREVLGATITVAAPMGAMPLNCLGRRANPAIGVSEALQLIAGRSYPRLMTRITPNFEQFMDGGILAGAYGPRVRPQLVHVVNKLRADPWTRQAVLQIWDPTRDLFDDNRDVACTLSLQFILRGTALRLHSTMRSQDAWWGLTYDIFMFAELLGSVANLLGVTASTITHTVGSLHVYERDFERIEETLDAGVHDEWVPFGIGLSERGNVADVRDRADVMLRGVTPEDATDHELWMLETLEKYR